MSLGTGIFLALAAVIAVLVLAPLFRRDADERERTSSAASEIRELHSRHEMALAALKDLEDDRATGKIGDDDYQELKAGMTVQAVELMKRLDALEEPRPRHPRATRFTHPRSSSDRT